MFRGHGFKFRTVSLYFSIKGRSKMRGDQTLQNLFKVVKPFVKRNLPTILTSIGVVGVAATAVASAKATPKAVKLLEEAEEKKGEKLTKLEKVKVAGPVYIPAIAIGTTTIACVIGSNAVNKHRQAALISAYAVLDQSYKTYRDKAKDIFGEEADTRIMNEIAKDKFEEVKEKFENEDKDEDVKLFFEEYSGRFFEATMADVLEAEYHFNRNFALRDYADLNELYSFLGLPQTEYGATVGWGRFAGEAVYGYQWVDFCHVKDHMPDGREFYRIEMPFSPSADYLDY